MTRQSAPWSWIVRFWQPMSAAVGLIVIFVVMNESIKVNAKDVETLTQRQKAQNERIEQQRREVELLKQQFARVDERINGVSDKIDGQTRTIERILDVVQRR